MIRSDRFRIEPREAARLREEVWVHPDDAAQGGIQSVAGYGIWARESLFIGAPNDRHAVLIRPDQQVARGCLHANRRFLQHVGIDPNDPTPWTLEAISEPVKLRSAVFETATEIGRVEPELFRLRRLRSDMLDGRCLLFDPQNGRTDLALAMEDLGYFNLKSHTPLIEDERLAKVLVFDPATEMKLFVPHRRGGVDMVIAVDVSGSMTITDYVGEDGRPRMRLDGARDALLRLFEQRLVSGSRVSHLAVLAFAGDSRPLYPPARGDGVAEMFEVRGIEQLDEMRDSAKYLNTTGIRMLKVNLDGGTNISGVLRDSADLLDIFARETNEKLIVLLSDGAHTSANPKGRGELEMVSTIEDPAVMADALQHDCDVRICTVAISNAENLRRYAPAYSGKAGYVPDVELLRRVAQATDGMFFDQPDARALGALLDLLGQGVMYPI